MTDLDLPPIAYHPTEEQFDENDAHLDGKTGPASISEVEQLIRVALLIGGTNRGESLAEKAIEFQRNHERENVFDGISFDGDNIEETNDVWLSNTLEDLENDLEEAFYRVANDILEDRNNRIRNRRNWYDNMTSELRDKISRARQMLSKRGTHPDDDGLQISAKRITNDPDTDDSNEIAPSHLDNEVPLEEFGLSLPVTLLVFRSPSSGSLYPFVPLFGTTSCTCGYKQENPTSTLCKHEVATLLLHSDDEFSPDGTDILERHKRLISPQAYTRFKENVSF